MTQEDYYQEIVNRYLTSAGDYMDFLLNCIENPTTTEEEALARTEFISNWHGYFWQEVSK